MTMTSEDSPTSYKVVVNDEEQYSIYAADAQNPPGWRNAGMSGTTREGLNYITKIWKPISVQLSAACGCLK